MSDLLEQEILDGCKTVKKSRDEIENFVQRNYNEAEKRQIKFQKKKNKMQENELNMDDFISNYGENHNNQSKNLNNISSKISNSQKQQPKYHFQVYYNYLKLKSV